MNSVPSWPCFGLLPRHAVGVTDVDGKPALRPGTAREAGRGSTIRGNCLCVLSISVFRMNMLIWRNVFLENFAALL